MRAGPVWLLLGSVVLAGCGAAGGPATTRTRPSPPPPLAVYVDGSKVETIHPHHPQHIGLPDRAWIVRGKARILVEVPLHRATRAVRLALAAHRSRVDVPFIPDSSSIRITPVRQVLQNDCEATSLSMLLTAAGVHVSQLKLQAQLPESGPLDPVPVPGSSLFRWGDPERGFVGRVDGSGPEGGFGVYEPPIRRLAARHGVRLIDLQGRSVAAVRAAVLAGHPVMAWVGLAAGPYASWLTPSGKKITVNFGEHAIVLVGADSTGFLVNNPLSGREVWSNALFSYRWGLLGHRALELP